MAARGEDTVQRESGPMRQFHFVLDNSASAEALYLWLRDRVESLEGSFWFPSPTQVIVLLPEPEVPHVAT